MQRLAKKYPPYPLGAGGKSVTTTASHTVQVTITASASSGQLGGHDVKVVEPSDHRLLITDDNGASPLSSDNPDWKLIWPLQEASPAGKGKQLKRAKKPAGLITEPPRKKPRGRNPKTNREMISEAILSQPSKKANLQKIYGYYESHYQDYVQEHPCWQNVIRHTLSINNQFGRIGEEGEKGGKWFISKSTEEAGSNDPSTVTDSCLARGACSEVPPKTASRKPRRTLKPKGVGSYAEIISAAIADQPTRTATRQQIYEYIQKIDVSFTIAPQDWKGSVRTELKKPTSRFEETEQKGSWRLKTDLTEK